MPRGFPVKKMKDLQGKIQSLDDDNQKTVLKILREDNIMYTENTNGVFFDIMALPKETLDKIIKLIEFCDNCNAYLDQRDKEQHLLQEDIDEENKRDTA